MKFEPLTETEEGKFYFLGYQHGLSTTSFWLWSQYRSGKQNWSTKPGIGIHFAGGPALDKYISSNSVKNLVALLVPDDHAKRWKAKK